MTLPESGEISISAISVELGRAANVVLAFKEVLQ